MPHTVPVLCGDSKHRLVGFFDSSAFLPDRFSVGGEDGSWSILDQYSGMLTTSVADTRILPCGYAPCIFGYHGIGVHVDKIKTCFTAPTSATCTLSAGYSVCFVDPLTLRSGNDLDEIFCIAEGERKYLSGTS